MPTDSRTTEFRGDSGGQHDRLHSLGKYQIQKKLGQGGMGTVFLAVDRELKRTVALKVLPKERAENPTLVKRFKSEAQAAALLEHKNIVRVYEAGQVDGYLYIALEYVEGIDVHELVAKRGVLPVRRSIDIVRQVALALDHAASRQIVHRDIKPANLLIKRDGTVKLADMGLARSIDEATETNITRAGMTVGTVDYMSPEQARSSQSADVRSDIYSLGCTWYHMLTGQPPYSEGGLTEKLQAHALSKRPNPRLENDAVPEAVVAVMQRMMARKPNDRYQTANELLADLELASKSLTTLNATAIEALAEESGASSRSRSRAGSATGPAALPPKDGFKPVDLTKGRAIDIDILRFAIPAVLVIVVLGVLVWAMRQGDDIVSGGAGSAAPFPGNRQVGDGEVANAPNPDGSAAPGGTDSDPSGDSQNPGRGGLRRPSGPPPVVAVPFPGAEDAATTAEGIRLIPDWVNHFRAERVGQARTLRVTRRANGGREFRRLDEALVALPREGGIVELDDDGPLVLEPASLVGSGIIRMTAAAGRHPVIFLPSLTEDNGTDAVLTVRDVQLEIDNVHFVMVDPPAADVTLIRVEDGSVALRNCSITADGSGGGTVTAIDVGGQSPGGRSIGGRAPRSVPGARPRSSSARCLLENVLCRGDRLTAVHLRGSTAELVTGNCLLHSGDAPTIVVTDAGPSGSARRSLRLLATTLISNRSVVRFTHTGDRPPGACEVIARKSLLAHSGEADPGTSSMVTLEGWTENTSNLGASRATGVDWSTEETLDLGWPSLVRMDAEDGTELSRVTTADEWRRFWDKPLASGAVAGLTDRPPGWDRPASITPADVAPETWTALADLQRPLDAGCRPDDFGEIPFGMIEHVTVASRGPEVPAGFGADLQVNVPPIKFNLMRRRSFAAFLRSDTCPDGAHVIASGSGLRKLQPVEIADKSIRLEFQSTGSTPLVIQMIPASEGDEPPAAAITLRNATLDLVGARFKMPATSARLQPPWLIRIQNASLSVRQCTIEGPSTASPGHSGLIQFADDGSSGPDGSRSVLIEDSYLASTGRLLSGPMRWDSLILRNSVLITQGDLLDVPLDETGLRRQPSIVINHCTLAAGGAVFRFEGDVFAADALPPLNLIVSASLFAGSPAGDAAAATVVARESDRQTQHHVRWWGNANGFAATLRQYVRTGQGADFVTEFDPGWAATWGTGHEAHPLFGATDLIFAAPLPNWTELQPSGFALNPTSPAATWTSDRRAIGADLEHVGVAVSQDTDSDGESPRKTLGPSGTRSRNRNPF